MSAAITPPTSKQLKLQSTPSNFTMKIPTCHDAVDHICYNSSQIQTARSEHAFHRDAISDKERRSHSLPCETAPKRSSSNLAADASSTYSIRHTATTKQQSSYNIAPCEKHLTFVIILFCPTGPACVVPRHPAIERAALQPQATSCPVHGQHSEHLPFCEAPLRKFLPGHPGAIHDPWSQHCYAAPATEFPRQRTTRSHAPFARTFPSANETATTKRPQTSRVRDLNQTFCIQKFRDMHICSLIPNIFPNI